VDARSFERLFEEQFDAVYGYLARRVGPDVARDLAAETFTRAFAARRRYDPRRGEPRAWLFGIAHNLIGRHSRDEERRLRAFARLEKPPDGAPAEEPMLASALASLASGERDVLLLFAWADLTYEEIAAVLDIPVGTVRSRLSRARQRMRAALMEEACNG
jgi:RNA polymerase sigma factor (sigma-70 family)